MDADDDSVIVRYRGRELHAKKGEKLRDVLLKGGVHPHNGGLVATCGGRGACGTCAVGVVVGGVDPASASARERFRLGAPPHSAANTAAHNLRLACQVRLSENLLIQKFTGFCGHKQDIVADVHM